jgi:uncharacterized protein (TIGR03382 family)
VGNFSGLDWIITYQADYDNGAFTNGNDVALMAIPEPSTALFGGLGFLGLLRRRRKQVNAKRFCLELGQS